MNSAVALILGVLVLAICFRLVAGGMDRTRIEQYVAERGGRIISINWSPFGKGWFGEQSDRIYEVVYYDRQGDQHLATCKTRLFGSVYFTDDRVSHRRARWEEQVPAEPERSRSLLSYVQEDELDPAAADSELERLREENRNLREQIEQFRSGGA